MIPLRRLADEQRPAPNAGRAQEVAGDELVAAAEHADQRGGEDRRGDVEAEGREVLSGANRERKRERSDQ